MKLFKSLFLSAAALAATVYASANDNRIIIERTNGDNIEYNVNDIKKINFGELNTSAHVLIYENDGIIRSVDFLDNLFIAAPSEAGKSTGFAFGTAAEPDSIQGLWRGKYAFGLSLSSSALYSENVALVDNASAVLTRYTYEDGELVDTSSAITSGTVTSSINTKNRQITLLIEATFEDGMKLITNIVKRPTEVESIDLLTPPEVFTNELVYFNMDGEESIHAKITEVTRGTYNNLIQFTFKAESTSTQGVFYTGTIQIAEELFGEPFNFLDVPQNSLNFRYENIQVSGPNNQYRNQAMEATGLVRDNGNGTWTFEFDVTNKYKVDYGWGTPTVSGTPERVVIFYTGEVK